MHPFGATFGSYDRRLVPDALLHEEGLHDVLVVQSPVGNAVWLVPAANVVGRSVFSDDFGVRRASVDIFLLVTLNGVTTGFDVIF